MISLFLLLTSSMLISNNLDKFRNCNALILDV
nr:MAG TPA: hypothetical protein [Caudoviricetes sp.]